MGEFPAGAVNRAVSSRWRPGLTWASALDSAIMRQGGLSSSPRAWVGIARHPVDGGRCGAPRVHGAAAQLVTVELQL